jgi:hypothetical protein
MRSQFQLIWPPFLPQNPSFCVDLHRARPQTHTNHFDVHTPLMKYQHSHGLLQGVPQTSGFNKSRICSWSTIGRMDGGLFPGRVNIVTFSHVPRLWSPHIFLSSWYFYLSSGYFFLEISHNSPVWRDSRKLQRSIKISFTNFALHRILIRIRDSSVSVVSDYKLDYQISKPGRCRYFPLASVFTLDLRPTQPPIHWVPGVLSPGSKARPGHDSDHAPSPSFKVKNEKELLAYSSSLWRLHGVAGQSFCFFLSDTYYGNKAK